MPAVYGRWWCSVTVVIRWQQQMAQSKHATIRNGIARIKRISSAARKMARKRKAANKYQGRQQQQRKWRRNEGEGMAEGSRQHGIISAYRKAPAASDK